MDKKFALIVEEDDQLIEIFSNSLEGLYVTEVVRDGFAAMVRLIERQPSLVLLDLHLSGISGFEILASIRSDPFLDNTHVILFTADERWADMLQEQVDAIIMKPVNSAHLREIASRFLLE